MTTLTPDTRPRPQTVPTPTSVGILTSAAVLSRRSLRHSFRDPEAVLMAVLLPLMMMLIFVYVLGGAMSVGTSRADYLAYVLPAIALTAAGFGAATTAVAVSGDMSTGLIDRLRTMPFPAVTVLLGHTVASLVRNLLATAVVVLVALAVGLRTSASPLQLLGSLGLVTLWILAITAVFATLGMLARSAEAANGYGFALLFLPYLSSGFAPVESMPAWLRAFAAHQPMTPLIDASRALMNGSDPGGDARVAIAWCLGLVTLALAVAAYVFPRRTSR